eukprot:916119-Pelagomonas_calceolata.AAC.5
MARLVEVSLCANCTEWAWRGKGYTLAQKSCESPPPQSYKTENPNGDLEGLMEAPGSRTWL